MLKAKLVRVKSKLRSTECVVFSLRKSKPFGYNSGSVYSIPVVAHEVADVVGLDEGVDLLLLLGVGEHVVGEAGDVEEVADGRVDGVRVLHHLAVLDAAHVDEVGRGADVGLAQGCKNRINSLLLRLGLEVGFE